MDKMADPVKVEYMRCIADIGELDLYKDQDKMGISDVLYAHFLIADFFYKEEKGLGGIGLKSEDLLHSAVYRQHISFDGQSKWTDFFEVVATLFYGLIKNHPFHDANKRTAMLVLLYHLSERGHVPRVSDKVIEDFAVEVAEDRITKRNRYKVLKKKGDDAEIKFIAEWLRKNTRKQTKSEYIITYRELDSILHKHGFELGDPSGNYIDINRVRKKRRFITRKKIRFITRKEVTIREKLGRIGFPSMTRQVSKSDLRSVRRMTGLTAEKGYDSEVFYNDVKPLGSLIAKYQDALRRLSTR